MEKVSLKFKKDVSPFKKGDIISVPSKYSAKMIKTHGDDCEVVKDSANLDADKLSKRQEKEKAELVEKLKKKADELESARN